MTHTISPPGRATASAGPPATSADRRHGPVLTLLLAVEGLTILALGDCRRCTCSSGWC